MSHSTSFVNFGRGESVYPEHAMLNALVVDDSMLIRHTVSRYLEERGFTVETATNGQEALESLKRLLPDLIITDMQMPKMGGSELITALKSNSQTANIPVVVVSSKQNESMKRETRADLKIYKDIEIEDQLANALQTVLGTGKAQAQTAGK